MTEESFKRYSRASKARWAKRTPEDRSAYASNMAKARWANKSVEQRKAHSDMMLSKRAVNIYKNAKKEKTGDIGETTDTK